MTIRRKIGLGLLAVFTIFLFLIILGASHSGQPGTSELPPVYHRTDVNTTDAKSIPYDIMRDMLGSHTGELVVFSGPANIDGNGIRVFVKGMDGEHSTIHADMRRVEGGTPDHDAVEEYHVKVYGFATDEKTWRGDPIVSAHDILVYGEWDRIDANVKPHAYAREALCDNCILHTVMIRPNGGTHYSEDYGNGYRMGGAHDVLVFDFTLQGLQNTDMSDIIFHMKFEYDGEQYTTVPLNDHDRKFEYMPLFGDMTGEVKPIEDSIIYGTWRGKCTVFDEKAIKPDRMMKVCFPVPTAVTDIIEIGMFLDNGPFKKNQYATIDIGPKCMKAYCMLPWDVPKPNVPQGWHYGAQNAVSGAPHMIYEYAILDTGFYNATFEGYDGMIRMASAAGLERWGELNNMEFRVVSHQRDADFVIRMGGTGESAGILGITDKYGSVNDVGCLTDPESDECTITLFVEDAFGASFGLHNQDTISFVVAHEFGHLLGYPHHGSSLHLMYSPMDPNKEWYDDGKYGHVVPMMRIPDNKTIRGDSYGETFIQVPLRDDAYDSYG